MDEDETQQFSLRWHNHQTNVIGALGRMLTTGALADIVLSASGTSVRAHKVVLASCSQYFAQLFKEVECENNTLVVVLGCEAVELKLLLNFMYTGEVTAPRKSLPSLLRLAQTLKVSGLTDADTNSTLPQSEIVNTPENEVTSSPINLELNKTEALNDSGCLDENMNNSKMFVDPTSPVNDAKEPGYPANAVIDLMGKNDKDRLSKLDQIVQNLYSTHKIGNNLPVTGSITPPVNVGSSGDQIEQQQYDRKWRLNSSVCTVCNKRLSNQYNLRVHMETHAGRRHACRACSHVSRSRDALRKHVAYRHAPMAREARGGS